MNLTVTEALKILKEYSCIEVKTAESETEKEQLHQAILLVAKLSESLNLGICADNSSQGFETLSNYLKALGYQIKFEQNLSSETQEPVYLKFSGQRMSYFVDTYLGNYRGVLISCQSENEDLNGTYGHFPLNLFS